ncbi:MAG: hypothetical protein Q9219_000628 [cf. Caloplaca sp. 3 TL-2023]
MPTFQPQTRRTTDSSISLLPVTQKPTLLTRFKNLFRKPPKLTPNRRQRSPSSSEDLPHPRPQSRPQPQPRRAAFELPRPERIWWHAMDPPTGEAVSLRRANRTRARDMEPMSPPAYHDVGEGPPSWIVLPEEEEAG